MTSTRAALCAWVILAGVLTGCSHGDQRQEQAPARALGQAARRSRFWAAAISPGFLLASVAGIVLAAVVAGEWLGLFARLNRLIPLPAGAGLVVLAGWRVFAQVARAALARRITSHTLMTLGALAALSVGQWTTAALVVLFMLAGDYLERFTTRTARRAVQDLAAAQPRTARVEREGTEQEIPAEALRPGEVVIVRPGEQIPADGEVVSGHATVDQSAITGEPLPVDLAPGSRVFAASIAQSGSVRVRVTRAGAQTTFGQVVRLVEAAQSHRAQVQRFADRFSAYFLPLVAGVAALTFLVSRNPLATAAVLVVACSCSIALATPVAMLAAIGAGARRGLLVKGGKYLEALAQADVVLVDKTGTLTTGRPRLTDVVALGRWTSAQALALAATAERYSEHPVAEALRAAAQERGLPLGQPQQFEALPGRGVRALVDGHWVTVGNRHFVLGASGGDLPESLGPARPLEAAGKTLLYLSRDGELVALLAVADTLRPDAPAALAQLRALGVRQIELLTGDHHRAAATLAAQLGVPYRAGLLPQDKIAVVRDYQARGH